MGDKSKLCASCGRWNEKGVAVYEDETVWWTCYDCLQKEINEETETSGRRVRLTYKDTYYLDAQPTMSEEEARHALMRLLYSWAGQWLDNVEEVTADTGLFVFETVDKENA